MRAATVMISLGGLRPGTVAPRSPGSSKRTRSNFGATLAKRSKMQTAVVAYKLTLRSPTVERYVNDDPYCDNLDESPLLFAGITIPIRDLFRQDALSPGVMFELQSIWKAPAQSTRRWKFFDSDTSANSSRLRARTTVRRQCLKDAIGSIKRRKKTTSATPPSETGINAASKFIAGYLGKGTATTFRMLATILSAGGLLRRPGH